MGDLAAFLADVYLKQGNLQAGVVQFENALLILDELATHDPENARWMGKRLRTLGQLAEVAANSTWTSRDEQQLEEAISGLRSLVELDGTRPAPRRQLALALRLKALLDYRAEDMPQAMAWAEQARRVLAAGGDDLATRGTEAAIIGEMLGLAAAGNGEHAKAQRAWQLAIDALPDPAAQDMLQKALFARLAAHLGREAESQQSVLELREIGFADPRYPLPANES
jgi:tetratricopeptide (TPR) repeat protein